MTGARGLVVGLDASTTACKAVVVDRAGRVASSGRAAYGLACPEPDGWEQDAEDWWRAAVAALREAATALGERAAEVCAVAIACQRETVVTIDPAGAPRAPALVWMDARSGRQVDEVRALLGEETILRRTGKVPCTTPSLYKLRWLLGHARPELRSAATRALDVHGFLAHRMTGRFATSTAAADPMGMIDLASGDWDDELLASAHLARSQVPALVAPGATLGPLRDEVADATGLPRGTLLVAGAGDGQAAGLGAGACEEGALYLNVGTALVAGRAVTAPAVGRAFRALHGPMPGTWFLETDLLGGTFSLDWLASLVGAEDENGRTARLAALEAEAAALPPGAGGLAFLPYLAGVMNPHWDAEASGALLGLRGDHRPHHVYRAVVEGLAFESRSQIDGLERAAGPSRETVAVGGAMQRPLLAQIFADVLRRPLARTEATETTALGAACLAATGAGWFDDARAAARAMSRRAEGVTPGEDEATYAALRRNVFDGLYEALAPRLHALAALRRVACGSHE